MSGLEKALSRSPAIDPAWVKAVDEVGHVCVRGLATREELEPFAERITEVVRADSALAAPVADRDTYGKAFLQSANLWRRDPDIASFTLSPRFAEVAAALLGVERVRLYHDQALFKEAGGGRTPWHRDQVYWPLATDRTITMWMSLDDMAPDMGAVVFASGSHHLDVDDLVISDDSELVLSSLVENESLPVESHAPMQVGDASFHLGATLHAAGANQTGTMRAAMTVIYVADGARVAEPTPPQGFDLVAWLPGLEPGDLVASELNPLL